ncbi:uncharacterized protein LOC120941384 [Rana temporaria]|uniref:uncharacterized protein LOC120941384 n=1 Tax=Rana temporaria TaxID=8407 RepID=UPI001AAC781C|nr:uncharacterized protein LOC120941384 [Rana temporaria]
MVEEHKWSLLEKLKKYLSSTEKVGPLTIYRMKMEDLKLQNKVIMMVGETGSGKTTLINTMVNYIFGVEWKDEHRIQIIEESSGKCQAHSQTSSVTIYQINHEDHFRIPYSITIIDTPGFGDTRGIDHDEKIMKKIREFFTKCKFTEIDGICFVVQSSVARLTPTQVYIYDKVLSIFGNDIKDNIVVFTTFSDFQEPNVLSAIMEADVPCAKSKDGKPVYFMVNNSMLYANNRPGEVGKRACKAQEMQWEVGMESIGEFFLQYLPELASKDLTLTKEVLAKRNALDELVQKIRGVTGKQHELEQIQRALIENKEEVENHGNFESNVTETVIRKVDSSEYSLNCRQCNSTCHRDCTAEDDFPVYLCEVFDWLGICGVCKHGFNKHFLEKSYWKTFVETRKKTYLEMKEKYEKAMKKVMTLEDVLSEIKEDMKKTKDELLELTQEIAEILRLLQEIALNPNPVSTVDYMKLLIEKEKREGEAGFLERICIMEENIKKCELIVFGTSTVVLQPTELALGDIVDPTRMMETVVMQVRITRCGLDMILRVDDIIKNN